MATTDQLLELIFCWIEEREHFAYNLTKLAEELESLRKKCNVGECVGSSFKVLGAASMIGAGLVTLFTGGLGLSLMNLSSTYTSIGSTISVGTKIIEGFLSCSIMKKLQDIEKKSNEIAKKIQQILKPEKEVASPSAEADELEHHIMAEILRAIARQSGVNVQIINDSVISDMLNHMLQKFPLEKISDVHSRGAGGGSSSAWVGRRSEGHFVRQSGLRVQINNDSMINHTPQEFPLEKISDLHSRGAGGGSSSAWVGRRSEWPSGDWISTSDTKSNPQMKETCPENHKILVNSLVVSGVVILSGVLTIIRHDRKSITKLSYKVLQLLRSTGFQTTLAGGVMVVGGIGVMACELPEMIDNWKEMISGNHVTEASQSLRDTADEIQNATQTMKQQIEKIKKILQEIKQEQQKTKEIKQEQQKTKKIKQVNPKTKVTEQVKQKTEETEQEESSEEETEDPPAVNVGLLNVRSILSITNMKEKRLNINDLITEHNLDVFLMTETWLENETAAVALREAAPQNFEFHQESRIGKGGGVAIQFSQRLCSKIIQKNNFKHITTFEYVATALRHEEWDEDVLFINVYQPGAKTNKQFCEFVDEFEELLKEASTLYNCIVVAGDFNVDLGNNRSLKPIVFQIIYERRSFKQHVDEPTHNQGGILDLVFSRNVEVSPVIVNDDKISDHFTVYFSIRPMSEGAKTKANPLKNEE